MNNKVSIISLGAGMQSSDMMLRGLRGEFDKTPDYAVFADTGNEPKGVYKYLEWLIKFVDQEYGFEIRTISAGNIYEHALRFSKGETSRTDGIPLHIKNKNGGTAILKRQCTGAYKIIPIRRHIKSNLKNKTDKVELWLGISADEVQRMKVSKVKWCVHRFPLIEKRPKRYHCIENFKKYNLPVPIRSSCVICPYHSDKYWYWIYKNEPESFESAVVLYEHIRNYPGIVDAECFLHRSCRPLKEVIKDIVKGKKLESGQMNLFPELIDECEGLCGV